MAETEIDPTVERVARALCQADGKDPDATYQTRKMICVRLPNGFEQRPEELPNWTTNVEEARRFVAAFNAMNDRGGNT